MKKSNIVPGRLRIRGKGHTALVGYDLKLEAQQANGKWLALTGITRAEITLRPDDVSLCRADILLSALDLNDVPPEWVRAR